VSDAQQYRSQQNNIPIPDPSIITTAQIDKAVIHLRDEMRAADVALTNIFDQKLVTVETKFADIGQRFSDVAARTAESAQAASTAIAAAFLAQEKLLQVRDAANTAAVQKSEEGFQARIGALETQITSGLTSQAGTINDIKERFNDLKEQITRLETTRLNVHEARADTHMTIGNVMGIVMGIIGVMSLIAVVAFGLNRAPAPVPVPVSITPHG
jgi:hypothetical protein